MLRVNIGFTRRFPCTQRKIQEGHQRFDAFQLRVLARTTPTIDLMTLQAIVASLRVDVDAILDVRVPEPEATPVELSENTVLSALF